MRPEEGCYDGPPPWGALIRQAIGSVPTSWSRPAGPPAPTLDRSSSVALHQGAALYHLSSSSRSSRLFPCAVRGRQTDGSIDRRLTHSQPTRRHHVRAPPPTTCSLPDGFAASAPSVDDTLPRRSHPITRPTPSSLATTERKEKERRERKEGS